MKKDKLICFRTSKELQDSLASVAKEDERSISSTIEMALIHYLKERKAFQSAEKGKRQYQRKTLSVPAVINQQELGQMALGSITEISLGGVRVLIPKDAKYQILMDPQGTKFEIFFNLPNETKPIKLSCESKRVVDAEGSIQVGACFVDADFMSYKTLQTYLM